MDLSSLQNKRKTRKRVGRGPKSGHGKTSGRGHKGQKARSGFSKRAGFEGGQNPLFRRLPKRGFRHQKRAEMAAVNVDILNDAFEDGADVTTLDILGRHLVHEKPGGIKLLGRGDITKKFTLRVQGASQSAIDKVTQAGGQVEIVALSALIGGTLDGEEAAAAATPAAQPETAPAPEPEVKAEAEPAAAEAKEATEDPDEPAEGDDAATDKEE